MLVQLINDHIDKIDIHITRTQSTARLFTRGQLVESYNGVTVGYIQNYVGIMPAWKQQTSGIYVKVGEGEPE